MHFERQKLSPSSISLPCMIRRDKCVGPGKRTCRYSNGDEYIGSQAALAVVLNRRPAPKRGSRSGRYEEASIQSRCTWYNSLPLAFCMPALTTIWSAGMHCVTSCLKTTHAKNRHQRTTLIHTITETISTHTFYLRPKGARSTHFDRCSRDTDDEKDGSQNALTVVLEKTLPRPRPSCRRLLHEYYCSPHANCNVTIAR